MSKNKQKKNKRPKVEEEDVVVEKDKDISEDCLEDKEIIREIQKIHKIMAGKRPQPEITPKEDKQSKLMKEQVVGKESKKNKKKAEEEPERIREMEQLMADSDEEADEEDSEEDKDNNGIEDNDNNDNDNEEEDSGDDDKDENDEQNGNNESEGEDKEESEDEPANKDKDKKSKKVAKEKVVKHKPGTELIVKNLPFTATKKQILRFFNELGQVASVKLIEKNGKPQGKALVICTSPEAATKALNANGEEFQGRILKVKKLEVFEKTKKTEPQKPPAKIFVGGLAADSTEKSIKDFFRNCGKIRSIVMTAGKRKGYALIEFELLESAQKALELSGKSLNGKEVKIEMAKEKKNK